MLSDDQTRELLRTLGAADPVLLGTGMEGAVYALDDDRVVKLWFSRPAGAVTRVQRFSAALDLPFGLPRIHEVREVDGTTVSVEQRLHGITMQQAMDAGSLTRDTAIDRFCEIVTALGRAGPCPEARPLTLMAESEPLTSWAELVADKAGQFAPVLGKAVSDFERKASALLERLPEVDSGDRVAIHGDLVPSNILVHPDSTVSAVLDWGFFTTEADPAFDAAVSAALFDMYGPDALPTELALLDRLEAELGYSRRAMLTYRAAYSVITANVYSPQGEDGHFRWCAAALNRPDVTAALLA